MHSSVHQHVQAWRAAERDAAAAERALYAASVAYALGGAPPPDPLLYEQARVLRAAARCALAAMVRAMSEAADALRWPG